MLSAILWYVLGLLVFLWVRERWDSVPRWFDRRTQLPPKKGYKHEPWGFVR